MADRLQGNEEFLELIQPLLGLTVSLPWKGYGSAISLELGALAPLELPRQHHNEGEACIFISWDWRVEGETAVLYGSSNSGPKMEAGILSLQGETVQAVTIEEPVLEGGFLAYGCCTAEAGPFDGRVVSKQSGCPAFAGDEET